MHGKTIVSFILISIGILSLTPIQSKKIPGIIKKLNKALGLPAKSEKLFDILPNIETNMADISNLQSSNAGNSADIAANLARTETNADRIQTNADSIQTNADSIQTNADRIQINTDGIQTNADGIQTNADSIQTNANDILTNSADIAGNLATIETNADRIQTNADGIQTNADGIQTNADRIQINAEEIQTNAGGIQTNTDGIQTNANGIQINAGGIQALETMGSGSVWFDAFRYYDFDASTLTKINYDNARKSSSHSSAMNIYTGKFTAPLAGTYQFTIQATKFTGVVGQVILIKDYQAVSQIINFDASDAATMMGTVIIPMEAGNEVWAETSRKLYSDGHISIHFTGVLLTTK